MPKYVTKQRQVLLSYLEKHTDQQLSAKDISSDLAPYNVSLSSVYRNLSDLEQEGKLRRYSRAGNKEIYYQYTDTNHCRDALHLSCAICGKTFHMEESLAKTLIETISSKQDFVLDKTNTVLYGTCSMCAPK